MSNIWSRLINLGGNITGLLPALNGGTGADTSASTGVAKVASGVWSVATIVNADVSGSAAIAGSKLAAIAQAAAGVDTNAAQRLGTNTNDNASSGNIGEYLVGTYASSITSFTNGTWANISSITLTAGDWEISGSADFTVGSATGVTQIYFAISTYTGNTTTDQSGGDNVNRFPPPTSTAASGGSVSNIRVKSDGTNLTLYSGGTTFVHNSVQVVYFKGKMDFSGGSAPILSGRITAIRAR